MTYNTRFSIRQTVFFLGSHGDIYSGIIEGVIIEQFNQGEPYISYHLKGVAGTIWEGIMDVSQDALIKSLLNKPVTNISEEPF